MKKHMYKILSSLMLPAVLLPTSITMVACNKDDDKKEENNQREYIDHNVTKYDKYNIDSVTTIDGNYKNVANDFYDKIASSNIPDYDITYRDDEKKEISFYYAYVDIILDFRLFIKLEEIDSSDFNMFVYEIINLYLMDKPDFYLKNNNSNEYYKCSYFYVNSTILMPESLIKFEPLSTYFGFNGRNDETDRTRSNKALKPRDTSFSYNLKIDYGTLPSYYFNVWDYQNENRYIFQEKFNVWYIEPTYFIDFGISKNLKTYQWICNKYNTKIIIPDSVEEIVFSGVVQYDPLLQRYGSMDFSSYNRYLTNDPSVYKPLQLIYFPKNLTYESMKKNAFKRLENSFQNYFYDLYSKEENNIDVSLEKTRETYSLFNMEDDYFDNFSTRSFPKIKINNSFNDVEKLKLVIGKEVSNQHIQELLKKKYIEFYN